MKTPKLMILATALTATAAWAGPPSTPVSLAEVLKLKGDVRRGEAVYTKGCSTCHMPDGMGRDDGSLPVVASQHPRVLIKQIVDIRAGTRANPTMPPIVLQMQPEEMADVAAYMASLPLKPTNGKGPGTRLKRGETLYKRDCINCHGAKGEGNEEKFVPMLAGQHYRYMFWQMGEMHEGRRKNADKAMLKVIQPLIAKDLEAVTDYVSRLEISGTKR
jgi:cytochrome c553